MAQEVDNSFGGNFFGGRFKRRSAAVRSFESRSADPYGHVGTGKPSKSSKEAANYTQPPPFEEEEILPGDEPPRRITISADDALAQIYAALMASGGALITGRREDGVWLAEPLEPAEEAQSLELGAAELNEVLGRILIDQLNRFSA